MPITGHMIGKEVLSALGLHGQKVRAIDIRIATNEVVTLKVEKLMTDLEARRLMPVFEEYTLTPRPSILGNFEE